MPSALIRCEICRNDVQNDYEHRRAHIYEQHWPPLAEGGASTVAAEQKALADSMRRCFLGVTLVNDLMCNECGISVKASAGKALQMKHIREVHVLREFHCPVSNCPERGTYDRLRKHITSSHQYRICQLSTAVIQGETKSAKERYEAMKMAASADVNSLFPQCFPFVPGHNQAYARPNQPAAPRAAQGTPSQNTAPPPPSAPAGQQGGNSGSQHMPRPPPSAQGQRTVNHVFNFIRNIHANNGSTRQQHNRSRSPSHFSNWGRYRPNHRFDVSPVRGSTDDQQEPPTPGSRGGRGQSTFSQRRSRERSAQRDDRAGGRWQPYVDRATTSRGRSIRPGQDHRERSARPGHDYREDSIHSRTGRRRSHSRSPHDQRRGHSQVPDPVHRPRFDDSRRSHSRRL